jgi:hypothetical protein
VRQILEAYENVASSCSPDVCFQDARKYIPDLSERRGFDPAVGLSVLEGIGRMIEPVDRSLYETLTAFASVVMPVIGGELIGPVLANPTTSDQDALILRILKAVETHDYRTLLIYTLDKETEASNSRDDHADRGEPHD